MRNDKVYDNIFLVEDKIKCLEQNYNNYDNEPTGITLEKFYCNFMQKC